MNSFKSYKQLIRRTGGFFLREYERQQWFRKESGRLSKFKNCHKGEDCFIIGNGPSLNKMDLSLLNDYYTFGLNKIFLIFDRNPFDINYLVAINALVIEQSAKEFEDLDFPVFIDYKTSKKVVRSKDHIHHLQSNENFRFSGDVMQPIAYRSTVTFAAMQLAYFMGFKRVFLIGVDHSFAQKGKPNEKQLMEEEDLNHFDPNYFKGQNWQLADLVGSEIAYFQAKQHFENSGRQIIDATIGGKLDVYPKIDFKEALKQAKKK